MSNQEFELFLTRKLKRSTVLINIAMVEMYFRDYEVFDQKNVDNLLLDKIQRNCKGSYLNRLRTALLHYSDFSGIPIHIDKFKEVHSLQATMSDEEIEQFLSLSPPAGNSGIGKWNRWTMFWTIAAYSGIRPGNIASMEVSQVDFGQRCFVLPDTKTEPMRIPINPVILPKLEEYVKCSSSKYLFPLSSEKAPDKKYVEKPDWSNNFKVRTKMMGIKRYNLRPYSMRHSLCSRLADLEVNVFKIQAIMGHKSINTTVGYYHSSMK